nr:hypothetical protein [Deltaproteobacteria bacterium]
MSCTTGLSSARRAAAAGPRRSISVRAPRSVLPAPINRSGNVSAVTASSESTTTATGSASHIP